MYKLLIALLFALVCVVAFVFFGVKNIVLGAALVSLLVSYVASKLFRE